MVGQITSKTVQVGVKEFRPMHEPWLDTQSPKAYSKLVGGLLLLTTLFLLGRGVQPAPKCQGRLVSPGLRL